MKERQQVKKPERCSGMDSDPLIGITVDVDNDCFRLGQQYVGAVYGTTGLPFLIPPCGNPFQYAERIDGLLLSGGNDLDPFYYNEPMLPQVNPVPRQRSDFEISLLREMLKLGKPVFGICYGMQLINVALGGTLYQDIPSQFTQAINHRGVIHSITLTENPFFQEIEASVNSTHHQAIKEPAPGLKVIAYAPDKLIEAFFVEKYNFLVGVQWHPERMMEDSLSGLIFKRFMEAARAAKRTVEGSKR
jgi:putative glutamine amidotransferase